MARIEFPLGAIPVTGSDDFTIIDELAVLGRIVNPSGSLVLSSSAGSDTIVSGNLHVKGGGSVTVDGNVTVGGNVTFVSSSNLLIHDPLIVLALSQSAISPQFDSGFIVERGTAENKAFIWRESESRFAVVTTDETGSTAGTIPIKGFAPLKVMDLVLHSGTVTADNGHLILSSSAGSLVRTSGALTVGGTFTTLASSQIGGHLFLTADNLKIANSVGHLVLSSSAGSTVTVSGNLEVKSSTGNTFDGPVTLASVLTTNSSTGIVFGNAQGKLYNSVAHLVLSSSAGSTVTISGALIVKEPILIPGSASTDVKLVGSTNTLVATTVAGGNISIRASNFQDTGNLISLQSAGGTTVMKMVNTGRVQWANASNNYDGTGTELALINQRAYSALYPDARTGSLGLSSSLDGASAGITGLKGHFILSSSDGSVIAVSGTLSSSGPVYLSTAGQYFGIRGSTATNGVRLNSAFAAFGAGPGLYLTQDDGAGTGVYAVAQNFRGFNFGAGDTDFDLGSLTTFSNPKGLKMGFGNVIKWFGPAGAGGGAIQVNNTTGELLIGRNDSGSLYISGSGARNEIVAKNSHLILSSSVGSLVTISGAFRVVNPGSAGLSIFQDPLDFAARLNFRGPTDTFLAGVTVSSVGVQIDNTGFGQSLHVSGRRVRIGAAVSAGFPVVEALDVSGSILLQQPDRALIYATGSDLILSSSTASTVVVSGTLRIKGNTSTTTFVIDNNGSISTPRIDVTDNNDGSFAMTNGGTVAYGQGSGFVWSNSTSGNGGNKITRVSQLGTGSIGLSGALGPVTIAATTGDLILSSSTKAIALSGVLVTSGSNPVIATFPSRVIFMQEGAELGSDTFTGCRIGFGLVGFNAGDTAIIANNDVHLRAGSVNYFVDDLSGSFVCSTGHSVLSSSAGIVAISSSMKLHHRTSTTLPAGSDTLSGSMIWVSDIKCAAIYGPEGWTRIVTGTL